MFLSSTCTTSSPTKCAVSGVRRDTGMLWSSTCTTSSTTECAVPLPLFIFIICDAELHF
jgi:hypothetical protein